jgi:acetylornithine deacetylase/succinyl-diaminopimelate desuccinylase-like protein
MSARRLAAAALCLAAARLPAQAGGATPPLDAVAPPALRALGRDILAELVTINTVQPEGDVTAASERVAARFRAAGFPASDVEVVGAGPRTKNLVVRWRAQRPDGRKPILLFAHLDVVAARRDDWSMDPFVLTERDGWYYGRGTLDTKGGAAQMAAALLYLKSTGWAPRRDVILALTAGEESGLENGIEWLLAHRRDLFDVAWAWNADGGGGTSRGGRRVAFDVELAEKVYQSFTLTVRNAGGHSSVPVPDNAIYRLSAALGRLAAFPFPTHLTPVTIGWLAKMAPIEGGARGAIMARVAAQPTDTAAVAALSREGAYYDAELRTTCVATMLQAGHAENALPQRAVATVNCRLIPGEFPDSVRRTLERVVADTAVVVAPVDSATPSPPTPVDSAFFAAVGRAVRAAWEPLPVIPFMDTGASDGLFLRQVGIPTYIFWPLFDREDDMRAHGRDERISVEEFARGLGFTVSLLRDQAGGGRAM